MLPLHHSRETSPSLPPSIKGAIPALVKSTRRTQATNDVDMRTVLSDGNQLTEMMIRYNIG